MRDILEFFEICTPIFIIFLLIAAFGIGVVQIVGVYQCGNFEEMTGTETEWKTLDACYINTDQGWQRYDEYKMRVIAKDSLAEIND